MSRYARLIVVLIVCCLGASACSLPGSVTGDREITATFDDVGDLVVGHSVQIADVRIGSVTGIELTEDYRAKVTMSLKNGAFIPADSSAVLRTTSLLGEKFIELRPADPDNPMAGEDIADAAHIENTHEAPELEFVADTAVQLLGHVVTEDLVTINETAAQGFGGRGPELRSLVESLSTVSGTLAAQTGDLVRIIDALDGATETLATNSGDIGELLLTLSETSVVLAENRDEAIDAVEQLTRLARVQNDNIFEPFIEQVHTQITQLDAILSEVAADQDKLATLLYWLAQYTVKLPAAVPGDFAQVAAMFEVTP